MAALRVLTKILRFALVSGTIAAAAMCVPAIILVVAGGSQTAAVVFARKPDPAALPGTVSILSWSGRIARLDGVDAESARALHAAGAVLVMPMRKSGCISYRKT